MEARDSEVLSQLTRLERGLVVHSGWLLGCFTMFTLLTYFFVNPAAMPDFTDIHKTIGLSPMNAAGFAGVFALFVGVRPPKLHLIGFSVLALVLEAGYMAKMGGNMSFEERLVNGGGGLFLAGAIGLITLAFTAPSSRGKLLSRAMLRIALILVLYPRFSGAMFLGLYKMTPLVYDAYGLTVEKGLGFIPSLELARWQLNVTWVGHLAYNFYNRLPLFMAIAFCLCLYNQKKVYNNLFYGFLWAGLFGYMFYPLLPMVGIDLYVGTPPWPLGEFPETFKLKPVEAPSNYPRSCFPSLHGTWILMIYFSVYRISKWVNLAFLVVVFWTIVGTMAAHIGHYALDLLVAFPFALANQALCTAGTENNKKIRRGAIVFGLVATAGSALLIRLFPVFFGNFGWLYWGGAAIVMGLSVWGERELGKVTLADAESEAHSENSPS